MGQRVRARGTDGGGGWGWGREAGTRVNDEDGAETRGPRHSEVRKVWAEMVELEAAAGRDPRGRALELGW